ncbi:MAG: hypothetical protein IPO48_09385 [Saprospiraceae bacterium]|nr:hypothetical protein [Saprospiraceae bacterium]
MDGSDIATCICSLISPYDSFQNIATKCTTTVISCTTSLIVSNTTGPPSFDEIVGTNVFISTQVKDMVPLLTIYYWFDLVFHDKL